MNTAYTNLAHKLTETLSRVSLKSGILHDDAVSAAMGWAIGICLQHFEWSPEEIGKQTEKMAGEILKLANQPTENVIQ